MRSSDTMLSPASPVWETRIQSIASRWWLEEEYCIYSVFLTQSGPSFGMQKQVEKQVPSSSILNVVRAAAAPWYYRICMAVAVLCLYWDSGFRPWIRRIQWLRSAFARWEIAGPVVSGARNDELIHGDVGRREEGGRFTELAMKLLSTPLLDAS